MRRQAIRGRHSRRLRDCPRLRKASLKSCGGRRHWLRSWGIARACWHICVTLRPSSRARTTLLLSRMPRSARVRAALKRFEGDRCSDALTRADLGIRESSKVVLARLDGRKVTHMCQHALAIPQLLSQCRLPPHDFRLALRSLGQSRKRLECLHRIACLLIHKTEAVEMPHGRGDIIIRGGKALEISGSFRDMTCLECSLGCCFERFAVRFDCHRLAESRERARRIAGLERGKTSGQLQAVFIRGKLGRSRQGLEFRGGERWAPDRNERVGEHLAEGWILLGLKIEGSLKRRNRGVRLPGSELGLAQRAEVRAGRLQGRNALGVCHGDIEVADLRSEEYRSTLDAGVSLIGRDSVQRGKSLLEMAVLFLHCAQALQRLI